MPHTDRRHGALKQPILLQGLVLSIVASLFPSSARAQACAVVTQGQSRGKCVLPGAACKSGTLHGVCTSIGVKGEYECDCKTVEPPPPPLDCQTANVCPASAPLADHLFYIQDLGGGRCIDAGPTQSWAQGSQVVINACNQTAGQQIRIAEIDSLSHHDVTLSVSATLTNPAGICIGVHGGTVAADAALELQTCTNPPSPAQRFALDGDAILMGSQMTGTVARDFVIERQNGSTVPGTPLVVAPRVLWEEEALPLDARYFEFGAVDGSEAPLTSGFLTVSDEMHLVCAAQCGWGTVVEIDQSQPLLLTALPYPGTTSSKDVLGNIPVTDGTTIRGYRRTTDNGPEIRTCLTTNWSVFFATGQAIRFTGFRLHGPNGDPRCGKDSEDHTDNQSGIAVVRNPYWALPLPSVWIDHMEISHWPSAGSGVGAFDFPGDPTAQPSPCTGCGYPDTPTALVVGNFMHEDTYEVSPSSGQFAQIRANVFTAAANQPVSSREMSCLGGYAATDNLFETETSNDASDDVDMHGSLHPSHWYDGLAGDYFDVGSNTFLRTDSVNYKANVNQRGTACRFTAIHDNVFLQSQAQAIDESYNPPVVYNNRVNAKDPTLGTLLVGDFDADRIDDVFLATGAAWYYSSGGQSEWRYLNRKVELAPALLLGDFDGDGRVDVLTVHGGNIDVSWAGVSTWQTINTTTAPLSNLAVGDFDGDGRSDLLLATGTEWLFASGGQNWAPFALHSDTIPNLLFGHFTKKNKTQILRLSNSRWQVTELGTTTWTDLGPAPAGLASLNGLVTGDFNGDGYTDVAQAGFIGTEGPFPVYMWVYTSPGLSSQWSLFGSYPVATGPIGHFDGGAVSNLIVWVDNSWYFTHGPQNALAPLSRQWMR